MCERGGDPLAMMGSGPMGIGDIEGLAMEAGSDMGERNGSEYGEGTE